MAMKCPNCGQVDTAALVGDQNQCYTCGALFNAKGETVERGPDATTRAVMEARLRPRTDHPVGNFADLQRLGAEKAPDPDEPAFVLPAGVDVDRLPDGEPRSSGEIVAAMTAPVEQPPAEVNAPDTDKGAGSRAASRSASADE